MSVRNMGNWNVFHIRLSVIRVRGKYCDNCAINQEVEIIEGHFMTGRIHTMVSISSKYSESQFMKYLKGRRCMMIFDKYVNLKYKYEEIYRFICL